MAQHPSLKSKEKGKQHRSVLKRYERVKALEEKEKWTKGDSVFGLLKLKLIKFKLKKEKTAAKAEEGAEGAEVAPAAAEQAKDQGKDVKDKGSPEKK